MLRDLTAHEQGHTPKARHSPCASPRIHRSQSGLLGCASGATLPGSRAGNLAGAELSSDRSAHESAGQRHAAKTLGRW
jgi:hypothetical protein